MKDFLWLGKLVMCAQAGLFMILLQEVVKTVKFAQAQMKFFIWDCVFAMQDFSESEEIVAHVLQEQFTMKQFLTVNQYVL